ncbi:hypothetical protein H0H81_010050 [Sphagnurus paluster]|uniref:Clp1-like protein n=1 Tax=Sphagnurus paluster TaxID=117069 RepID=A0A9P7GI64_9AGAR|nr:hypothetical protein H0H81_010050 [Sphagnurus paluster]
MVLQSKLQSNGARRYVSNSENTPPASVLPSKSLASRLRTTRRRSRNNGGSPAKYNAEQAARRSRTKAGPAQASLRFKIKALPNPDVEMADASPSSTSAANTTVPVMLPKELGRPEYREVSREALVAADPELVDVNPVFLREGLEAFGPQLLKTLSSVRASTTVDALPKELSIVVHDLTTALPSHMIAVYGPAPKPTTTTTPAPKRKVTLYPVHSLYLAAHCTRLPPFPASTEPSPTIVPGASSATYTVPVRPLCLPSPATYPRLSTFLYAKRADVLLSSLLPITPPASLVPVPHDDDTPEPTAEQRKDERRVTLEYAHRLAQTYTPQALLQHALLVHGLWQNVCALGIFEDVLWEVIDVAWRVLLCAIALGTGESVEGVLGPEVVEA